MFEGLYLPKGIDPEQIKKTMAERRMQRIEERLDKLEKTLKEWVDNPEGKLWQVRENAKEAMESLKNIKSAIYDANEALTNINYPEWD